MSFDCGHTMDDIVGGVCAGCMADDDARLRELEAEVERLREALDWIARIAATEAEYKRVARQALSFDAAVSSSSVVSGSPERPR